MHRSRRKLTLDLLARPRRQMVTNVGGSGRTSMVALYHRSRSRISSVTFWKNLGHVSQFCSGMLKDSLLQREARVVLQVYAVLLRITEPIYNASGDYGILHRLICLGLQTVRMPYV